MPGIVEGLAGHASGGRDGNSMRVWGPYFESLCHFQLLRARAFCLHARFAPHVLLQRSDAMRVAVRAREFLIAWSGSQ